MVYSMIIGSTHHMFLFSIYLLSEPEADLKAKPEVKAQTSSLELTQSYC